MGAAGRSAELVLLTRAPWCLSGAGVRRQLGAAFSAVVRARGGQLGRGPEAVAASLTRGLRTLERRYTLNARRLEEFQGSVGVLSDLDALGKAIAWKRASHCRRLIAGPNLVVLPSDAPALLTAPEVDLCLVPSNWVKRLYEEDAPDLRGRIAVWPAGVDTGRFSPGPKRPGQRRALVYLKQLAGQPSVSPSELAAGTAALRRWGFVVTELRYGKYTPDDYREALRQTDVLVFFSPSESQCLALVEAWSTDVPSLVWACGRLNYRGRTYRSSSAPYLSSSTGAEFADVEALERMLERWDELRPTFMPRDWVVEHMSDEIAARAYWELAHPYCDPGAAAC